MFLKCEIASYTYMIILSILYDFNFYSDLFCLQFRYSHSIRSELFKKKMKTFILLMTMRYLMKMKTINKSVANHKQFLYFKLNPHEKRE